MRGRERKVLQYVAGQGENANTAEEKTIVFSFVSYVILREGSNIPYIPVERREEERIGGNGGRDDKRYRRWGAEAIKATVTERE